MATQQIDEYYESLAYWKQQAIDYEQELRDIKYNTIMNMTAEIEQLKAENICKDLKITIQHDKISALKAENESLKFQLLDRTEKYTVAMDKGVLELGDKIKELKAELDNLEQLNSEYKGLYEESRRMRSEISALKDKNESMNQANWRMNASLEKASDEITALKSKLKIAVEKLKYVSRYLDDGHIVDETISEIGGEI